MRKECGSYIKTMNYAEYYEDKKVVRFEALSQAYVDLCRNKQVDQHGDFKVGIQERETQIKKVEQKVERAEFEVDQYKSILQRTEIEVVSMGEKLKELSKLIAITEARTAKATILQKSNSPSGEMQVEEEQLMSRIEKN